ncbi:MAG: PilZ domain-containing protein [Thermodesulfobacteriota bacterium]
MEDNRQERRIPLCAGTTLTKSNGDDRIEAELVDISYYGVSLKTSAPLKTNERIKVSLTLNIQDQPVHSEEAPGSVRWVERSKEIYSAGIMFDIKINDKGFPIFHRCLEYLKSRE